MMSAPGSCRRIPTEVGADLLAITSMTLSQPRAIVPAVLLRILRA
jgi:hypothetical protein